MNKKDLYPNMKCDILYRVQGGKIELGASKVLLEIDNGQIKCTTTRNKMVYIGTKEHMWYFLRKRARFHKKVKNIRYEDYDKEIINPVSVMIMVVPSWFQRLIAFYAENPFDKKEKYKQKHNRLYTPDITDITTPGNCYGLAYYFKDLLLEVVIYCQKSDIIKQVDFITMFDSFIDLNNCNLKPIDTGKVALIMRKLNEKLKELGQESIPKNILALIEKDLPGFRNKFEDRGIIDDRNN